MTGRPDTGQESVAVVGAGIVGLATAFALSRRGVPVSVYERGRPGGGQSGGAARIFRTAHDDPRLAAAAVAGRSTWRRWEAALGVPLVGDAGAVALGPRAERRLEVLRGVRGASARPLTPDELARRLPVLAPYHGSAMLDDLGGPIRAQAAVSALIPRLDGVIVADEVLAIEPTARGPVVHAGGASTRHVAAVMCAGAGTAALARRIGLDLPLRVSATARATFAVTDPAAARPACLQDSSDAFGEPGAYGTPQPTGDRYAVGVGAHAEMGDGDADALGRLVARASAYVRRALPGLDPEPVGVRHCWVTELPWGSDALAVWQAGDVLVPAGSNLFKHAPWLAEQIADALDTGVVPEVLRPGARLGADRTPTSR